MNEEEEKREVFRPADELSARHAYSRMLKAIEDFGLPTEARVRRKDTEFAKILEQIAVSNFGEQKARELLAAASTQIAKEPALWKEQKQEVLLVDIVARVANGFASDFGTAFDRLPKFQQDAIKCLCALHLNYSPKDFAYSHDKAVYLCGVSQIGKTTVFEWLRKKAPSFFVFRIVTAYELTRLFSSLGHAGIETYMNGKCLVIDEVGMEMQGKHFGTASDVVTDIIHERYRKGLLTHMTSNFLVDDLPYGIHIKNRIKQGCNLIVAKGATPFMR